MLASKGVYEGGAVALPQNMEDARLVEVNKINKVFKFVQTRRVSLVGGEGGEEAT